MSNPTNPPPPANPGYVYSPPKWVTVNGIRCLEVDGGVLAELVQHNKGRDNGKR